MSLSSEQAHFNPYFIFPCYGKRPVFGIKWREISTNDPIEIRRLQIKYPSAVWAIDLDKSGLICLDCDKDGDNEGVKWLEGFCGSGFLNKVPGALSPSGGRHFYFRNPLRLGCSRGSLPPKHTANIDVKGVGGYVIMPGQTTPGPDGGHYAPVGNFVDAFDLSDDLVKMLMAQERHPSAVRTAEIIDLVPESRGTPWGNTALTEICRELSTKQPGELSDEATRLAFKAGQILEQGRIGLQDAYDRLAAATLPWGLPASDKLYGPRGTLWRALEAGMKHPRGPDTKDEEGPEIKFNFSDGSEEEADKGEDKGTADGGSGAGPKAEAGIFQIHRHGDPDDAPADEHLIEGILPGRGIVFVGGPSQMGKSTVAYDLAGAIMALPTFCGQKINKRGAVVWIAAEAAEYVNGGLRGMVEGSLRQAIAAGDLPEGYIDRLPFFWIAERPDLKSMASLIKLQKTIFRIAEIARAEYDLPLAMIVLDTLEAAGNFKDSNQAAEVQPVLNWLYDLSAHTDTVMAVIDHFGKDITLDLRGTSAKKPASYGQLTVLGKLTNGVLSHSSMHVARIRGGVAGKKFKFKLKVLKFDDGKTAVTVVWDTAEEPDDGSDPNNVAGFAAKRKEECAPQWGMGLGERLLKEAIDAMLYDLGRKEQPFDNEETVVEMKYVRQHFCKRHPAEELRKKNSAFDVAVHRARKLGLILTLEINGETCLWLCDVKK
jgi:hypothetical protein